MRKLVTVVFVVVLAVGCTAQFPGMPGFPGMGFLQNIMYNVGDMSARMSMMGSRMYEDSMRHGRRYGPGGTSFRTRDGQGYGYNSPDGSYRTFSYSYGSPGSTGYQYQWGPEGSYSRRW